jgi:pimeloyl-ACP methyl ester carboxylesterase
VTDDRTRSYDVEGPIGAPAVLFIHGTRLTRAAWSGQLRALRDTYRVIAVDLPGHGALEDVPFTLPAATAEVARVIREAATDGRAVVVGLSLGGYVAMDLACREPTIVRGLVLAGATQEPVGRAATPYRALAWALRRFDGPALDGLNAWFFRARYPTAIADPIVEAGFVSRGGAEALEALHGLRFRPRLAAYDGPAMLLNGQYDLLFRLGAPGFAASARDPWRVRLAGALHLVNLDRPAAFEAAVRRFMERLDDRP